MKKLQKQTKNLVIPIEETLKSKVKNILSELGMNQSQVVISLFKEIARTKKIPLSFDLNDAREATKAESIEIEKSLASGMTSADDIKSLEKELSINLTGLNS